MKILLINDYGGATGGAEIQMLTIRQLLRDRNHDVRLFSSNAELVTDSPILADYTCYGTTSKAQVISHTANLSAYLSLKKALEEFQPDVIHVRMFLWQLSPMILPLLKPYPAVYQAAVYKAICPIGTNILPSGKPCDFAPGKACLQQNCLTPQTWVWMMAQRSLWQRWKGAFNHIVALSQGMKAQIEQANIGCGPNVKRIPISVIYNGTPERAARPPLRSPPTVGYAGRFTAEKGIDTLFKAFATVTRSIPEAQLMMAGKGPLENDLRALAKELGIETNIDWLGHVPQDELERAFDQLWVQAVPSLWAEPFGNVTTEAMMRGTAVVASAVGAQPEIVGSADRGGDSVGTLVPPGDEARLADALLPILQDEALAEQMGAAGRRRVMAHFGEQQCVDNFLTLYSDLTQASTANVSANVSAGTSKTQYADTPH
ncbi:MAG: glycosyltransferase family 4 protein [Cyanobacteria bacterium P01_D01_bin.36]